MSIVKVLLILLAVWIVISILRLIIKEAFWLLVLGYVAFAVTSLVGATRLDAGAPSGPPAREMPPLARIHRETSAVNRRAEHPAMAEGK
jgi:hypothetical protein